MNETEACKVLAFFNLMQAAISSAYEEGKEQAEIQFKKELIKEQNCYKKSYLRQVKKQSSIFINVLHKKEVK